MTLEPGARLGPYEIGVLLGQGGMGDVYRALDARVGRTVAVKVLPPAAAAQPDRRQRFEREARAVARLNHPHICTLYDVGRQDDLEFLVMEYLDGETLGARLSRGPLPLAEALTHGAALAQALARAHREGITHRDIKPSNVMLTESGVKLLDFGLAKLRERDSGTEKSPLDDLSTGLALSPEGTLVGTIAYMSPEQLEGRPVDSRTDIYALGLLIYEMVTGQRAFVKGSQAGLIAAILTEEPPLMAAIEPKTPAPVERIVRTALAKDPNKRWQDANDLARELTWAASTSHTTTVDGAPRAGARNLRTWVMPAVAAAFIIAALGAAGFMWTRTPNPANGDAESETGKSEPAMRGPESAPRSPRSAIRNFVILPCRTNSDATAQAYCDGLTDTLSAKMTPLAVSRGLQVTSTLEVRRRGVTDATQARRDFGATLVLEGSILRAADSVRVNYVLVDTATLKQIDAYSSTAVGERCLRPPGPRRHLGRQRAGAEVEPRRAADAGGSRARRAGGAGGVPRGARLPAELPAAGQHRSRDREVRSRDRARSAIRARLLGPRRRVLAEIRSDAGHGARAAGARRLRAGGGARRAAGRIARLPRHGRARHRTGRAGSEHFQHAVEREPTSDEATLGLARAQARAGATAEAEKTYERAIALRPQYWATHVWLGTFYREHARYAEAVRALRALADADPRQRARLLRLVRDVRHRFSRAGTTMRIAACRKSVAHRAERRRRTKLGRRAVESAAVRCGDRAVRGGPPRRPEDYLLDGDMARAYFHAGKRDDATRLYRARDRPRRPGADRATRAMSKRESAPPRITPSSAIGDRRSST